MPDNWMFAELIVKDRGTGNSPFPFNIPAPLAVMASDTPVVLYTGIS